MTTDVWDLYAALGDSDRETLTPIQRKVVAICDLRQEVNAGGFDTYLRGWGGNTARTALAALEDALGKEWVDVLEKAMHIAGSPYPDDPDDRAARLDAGSTSDTELHRLDERFYDLEASRNADARMSDFLRRHGM